MKDAMESAFSLMEMSCWDVLTGNSRQVFEGEDLNRFKLLCF